jgi:hypothetical protein
MAAPVPLQSPVPLEKSDDLSAFGCGPAALNDYLRKYALQNHQNRSARNRSALECVIDQYQVSEDKRSGIRSDPNRADDREYIVRLVGQVVFVSVETVKIVNGLPEKYA